MKEIIDLSQEETDHISQLNIPESTLSEIFDTYSGAVKMLNKLRISLITTAIVTYSYNFFFAGKSYSISTANTIKYSLGAVLTSILILAIYFGIRSLTKVFKVKSILKNLTQQQNIEYQPTRKVFGKILKSQFGGVGI